mgnify:CR=1 FL=1
MLELTEPKYFFFIQEETNMETDECEWETMSDEGEDPFAELAQSALTQDFAVPAFSTKQIQQDANKHLFAGFVSPFGKPGAHKDVDT